LIEVDGGINYETAPLVKRAGTDIIVAGSFIFGSKNYAETIRNLRCCK
jgi:ribulose-phosphate 3-epimerase